MRTLLMIPVLLVALLGCAKTEPVYNVTDRPFPPAVEKMSLKQIGDAMIAGGANLGWSLTEVREGVLEGEYSKGRHYAKVMVKYDNSAFSIAYSETRVLLGDGRSVHRVYNIWIKRLEEVLWRSVVDAAAKMETG